MLCSVESSEIDLSEFEEESNTGGTGGDGSGEANAQPSTATGEQAQSDAG